MTIYLCISSMRAQLSYMSWENTPLGPKLFKHRIWWQNYANVFINQIYYLKFQNIIVEASSAITTKSKKILDFFVLGSALKGFSFLLALSALVSKYFYSRALPSIPKLTVCAQIFKFHLCKQMHSCKNQLLCYWIMHHYK